MNPDRKTKAARIVGYICVVAGALNLVLAGVLVLWDQTQDGFPLVATGSGALTLGIILLTRGKQKSNSKG